jgi:hypothetical protein
MGGLLTVGLAAAAMRSGSASAAHVQMFGPADGAPKARLGGHASSPAVLAAPVFLHNCRSSGYPVLALPDQLPSGGSAIALFDVATGRRVILEGSLFPSAAPIHTLATATLPGGGGDVLAAASSDAVLVFAIPRSQ